MADVSEKQIKNKPISLMIPKPQLNSHTSSSIPTKSGIVIKHIVKSKGFGVSADRFDAKILQESGEAPGPGKYQPKNGTTWGHSIGGSLQPKLPNKKSIPLITSPNLLGSFPIGYWNTGPGPGSYQFPSTLGNSRASSSSISLKPSMARSGFGTRSNSLSTLTKPDEDGKRGPGSYNVILPLSGSNSGVGLRSKSKRLQTPRYDGPETDFYEVGKNMMMKKPYVEANLSSAFASPVKNSLKKVRIHELEKIRRVIEIQAGAKEVPDLWKNDKTPAPGQYETQKSYLALNDYNPNHMNRGMPGFVSGNPRIPAMKVDKKPEPGTYNLPSAFDSEKFQVRSSMFVSESEKGIKLSKDISYFMMPAQIEYKPSHSSFHKNPKNKGHIWH